jgi:hypothetical protein
VGEVIAQAGQTSYTAKVTFCGGEAATRGSRKAVGTNVQASTLLYGERKTKAARRSGPLVREIALESLDGLNVLSLPALGAFDYVELNGLTFL